MLVVWNNSHGFRVARKCVCFAFCPQEAEFQRKKSLQGPFPTDPGCLHFICSFIYLGTKDQTHDLVHTREVPLSHIPGLALYVHPGSILIAGHKGRLGLLLGKPSSTMAPAHFLF